MLAQYAMTLMNAHLTDGGEGGVRALHRYARSTHKINILRVTIRAQLTMQSKVWSCTPVDFLTLFAFILTLSLVRIELTYSHLCQVLTMR
jgi:hypothetical protein